MSKPSKSLAPPVVVRPIPQEQIERGQRLQKAMEELDAEFKRELAEEHRIADEQQRVEQERAALEEARRAASPAGRYMDAKYGYLNKQ